MRRAHRVWARAAHFSSPSASRFQSQGLTSACLAPAVCPVEKAGMGHIRADCLEEEANGQHLSGWGHCPWRRRGGKWTAGSGEGGLDAHCHLCADTQHRNPSRSRCKDEVTHPAGADHKQGRVLHRSSEQRPQTHHQLWPAHPHQGCPGPPSGRPSPGTNALAWSRT